MFISDFKLKSSEDFPLDWIFDFLQILALTEPIMCIDWILLACLHLQMEAFVLFYPGKATGFCVCQHIKIGECGYFEVTKLYEILKNVLK